MKLISIKLTNYRIHREIEMAFDPSLTLIGGPNESGKSTLAEAAFNSLFMRAKRGGTDLRKLSSRHGGNPQVELVFEESKKTYSVRKIFRGPQGTIVLTESSGHSWTGDEAEEKLLQICGIDTSDAGGRGIPMQWAHLWVRQGESGFDPTGLATDRKDDLIARLQQGGGAATVLQSELDASVAAQVSAECDAIYGAKGGPKVDSDLGRAGAAVAKAAREREHREAIFAALEQAATDFELAEKEIADSETDLLSLGSELSETRKNLARVAELRSQEKDQNREAKLKDEEFQKLSSADASIKELAALISEEEKTLAPREADLVQREEAENLAKKNHTEAETAHAAAAQRFRDARIRRELAALCATQFEQSDTLEKLKAQAATAHALRSQLAALPSVAPEQLERLQKLDRDREKIANTLAAISTRLEVLSSNLPVVADGKPVDPHAPLTFSNDTEIVVGGETRLRITPGGGTSLTEARQKLTAASASLQNELDSLGVPSVQEATTTSAKRREIELRLEGTEKVDQELADATTRLSATDEDIRRRSETAPDFFRPAEVAAAGTLLAECQSSHDQAEIAETVATEGLQKRSRELAAATKSARTLREELQQALKTLEGLKGQFAQLVSTHGDEPSRNLAIKALSSAKQAADSELDSTRKSLETLQPEGLIADEQRLTRAIRQNDETKIRAGERLAVAKNILRSEGTSDPIGDLTRSRASERSALERLAAAQRHAQSLQLLKTFFSEEQQSLTDQFTRPLADKVSGYLQCLFGPSAAAQVSLVDGAFETITLCRQESGAFDFPALSGGTMEQVGVAFRLAMTEILAQDHGGCLPVILDDAFANSDPIRVAALQRMLDLAASRGLQIIVLSCTPSNYTALGAKTIRLQPTTQLPQSSAPTPPLESDNENPSASPGPLSVSKESRETFLNALKTAGGNSGNKSLRDFLGWDETIYEAVKNALQTEGLVTPGRGRGGSVSLAD